MEGILERAVRVRTLPLTGLLAAMAISVPLPAYAAEKSGPELPGLGESDAMAGTAGQQTEMIATDRPDFVESSLTVGSGRVQVETSVNYEKDEAAGVEERSVSTPTLLRIGVAPNWEVRFESDGYQHARVTDPSLPGTETRRGWNDLSLGLKWRSHDASGTVPSTAWIFHADLDSGSAAFRGDDVRSSLRSAMEWALSEDWALGVMPGFAWDKDEAGNRFPAWILGVTVARAWTGNFRTFAEVSAERLASGSHGGNVVTVDIGAAYLLTGAIQLDTALRFGASEAAPDLAWTAGFSVRF